MDLKNSSIIEYEKELSSEFYIKNFSKTINSIKIKKDNSSIFNTQEGLKEFIKNYNGNFSQLFPMIEHKIPESIKEVEDYEFFNEFSCFENDYAMYKLYMMENGIKESVIDIGTQNGYQSEIFLDVGYHGIDIYKQEHLNEDSSKVLYSVASFPDIDIDITDKVVISNMSIGWFENRMNIEELAKELSKAKYLFIATTNKLNKELEQYFPKKVSFYQHKKENEKKSLTIFGKKISIHVENYERCLYYR